MAVAALDNHVYQINAKSGEIITSFYIGTPIWDKIAKGDVLRASPIVIEAADNSAIIHGSYNDKVYTIPLVKECSLTARAHSVASLLIGLLVTLVVFAGIVVPAVLLIKKEE